MAMSKVILRGSQRLHLIQLRDAADAAVERYNAAVLAMAAAAELPVGTKVVVDAKLNDDEPHLLVGPQGEEE
jgi:hypothetical protein